MSIGYETRKNTTEKNITNCSDRPVERTITVDGKDVLVLQCGLGKKETHSIVVPGYVKPDGKTKNENGSYVADIVPKSEREPIEAAIEEHEYLDGPINFWNEL